MQDGIDFINGLAASRIRDGMKDVDWSGFSVDAALAPLAKTGQVPFR